MQLSNQDLSQIDEDELLNLPEEELRYLSIKLLNDLKEARERLSQNSRNSSRPPSSEAPWDKAATDNTNDQEQTEIDKSAETEDTVTPPSPSKKDQQQSADPNNEHQEPRKPGKQPGAQGFGRTQKLAITHYQDHYPEICACCHQTLEPRHAIAYAAYETINVEWGDVEHPGILVTHTKHISMK
ncbi:DUF6444 domain-containing protein [Methylomarinum sp. Ch1-1]|uniref:DUF6444 domain-containing protein n=1 Tax=Methylomarinum roseum TaxID=3067653 RepID=A0AAU7NY34_9GAMM